MEIFFNMNSVAAIFGWIAFNFIMLSSFKDDNEQTFNLKAYAKEYWDNWAGSLLSIPVLLYIGARGFNFSEIGVDGIHWSDAYYVFSGFGFEYAKILWKKWKNKQ